MPRYRLIWRAVADSAVISSLVDRGVHVTTGGPTHPSAPTHKRHQLDVEADSEAKAIEVARTMVEDAGGDAADISSS